MTLKTSRFAVRVVKDPVIWVILVMFIILGSGPVLADFWQIWHAQRDLAWKCFRFSPQRFLFHLIFFPMIAVLASFIATALVRHSEELFADPAMSLVQYLISHWRIVVLAAIWLTAGLCVMDYFFNPKSFDKF